MATAARIRNFIPPRPIAMEKATLVLRIGRYPLKYFCDLFNVVQKPGDNVRERFSLIWEDRSRTTDRIWRNHLGSIQFVHFSRTISQLLVNHFSRMIWSRVWVVHERFNWILLNHLFVREWFDQTWFIHDITNDNSFAKLSNYIVRKRLRTFSIQDERIVHERMNKSERVIRDLHGTIISLRMEKIVRERFISNLRII